jgi:hypothetical protein
VVCAGAGLVSYLFNYGRTSACNCRTALKAMRARSSSPCLTCENSGRGAMPFCFSSYFRFIWPRGPMDKASAYGAGDCRFESCRGHCCRSDSDSPKILPPPMWTKFIMAQPKHHHVWILPSLPIKYAHALSHGLCGTARMDTLPEWSKGWTQVPLAQAAWIQIPQVSFMILEWMDEWRRTWTPHVFSMLLFMYFVRSPSLSLSLFLSCSLSLSLTISLSLSLALVPPFCHPGHVFHSPACSAAGELHGCMSSELHTRPPLQFKKRFNQDVELLAS